MVKTIVYDGRNIEVSCELAEFLENDRKRHEAQERSDRRHLSLAVTPLEVAAHAPVTDPVFRKVSEKLTRKKPVSYTHLTLPTTPYV